MRSASVCCASSGSVAPRSPSLAQLCDRLRWGASTGPPSPRRSEAPRRSRGAPRLLAAPGGLDGPQASRRLEGPGLLHEPGLENLTKVRLELLSPRAIVRKKVGIDWGPQPAHELPVFLGALVG